MLPTIGEYLSPHDLRYFHFGRNYPECSTCFGFNIKRSLRRSDIHHLYSPQHMFTVFFFAGFGQGCSPQAARHCQGPLFLPHRRGEDQGCRWSLHPQCPIIVQSVSHSFYEVELFIPSVMSHHHFRLNMSIPDKNWQPPFVSLDTTMGEVVVELYWQHAPITCRLDKF